MKFHRNLLRRGHSSKLSFLEIRSGTKVELAMFTIIQLFIFFKFLDPNTEDRRRSCVNIAPRCTKRTISHQSSAFFAPVLSIQLSSNSGDAMFPPQMTITIGPSPTLFTPPFRQTAAMAAPHAGSTSRR